MDETKQRSYISEILIVFSLSGLVALAFAVIWLDKANAPQVFNSVLPLIGTWIGTVLAYYFSRSNFATAASAYKQLAAPGALAATPVTTAMIDKAKIAGVVTIAAGQTETNIYVQRDLLGQIKPPVTRIPILDSIGAAKYILHENTLNKFVTKNSTNPSAGFSLATATLATLLNDLELKTLATTFAIVPSSATLADAKQKMDEMPNCADIFVTETGKTTEPVLGWVTDATIAGHSRLG